MLPKSPHFFINFKLYSLGFLNNFSCMMLSIFEELKISFLPLKELLPEDYLTINDDNIEKNTDKKENHAQNKLSKKFLMALTLLIIILIGITVYIFKTNTYMINANAFTGVFLNNIQNRYLEIHSKEPLKNFSKIILYTYDENGRKDILSSFNGIDNKLLNFFKV